MKKIITLIAFVSLSFIIACGYSNNKLNQASFNKGIGSSLLGYARTIFVHNNMQHQTHMVKTLTGMVPETPKS